MGLHPYTQHSKKCEPVYQMSCVNVFIAKSWQHGAAGVASVRRGQRLRYAGHN